MSGYVGQQCFGFLQISGFKPFCEPGIESPEKLSRLVSPSLPLPQTAQAHRCPQLQRLRSSGRGDVNSLAKKGLGLGVTRGRDGQYELTLEPIKLRVPR